MEKNKFKWLSKKSEYGNYDYRCSAPRGYQFITKQEGRCLSKLGIERRETLRGFSKSGKYFSPIIELAISNIEKKKIDKYMQETKDKREKSKEASQKRAIKKAQEKSELATKLGLLEDSKTFKAFLRGDIEEDQARGIGEYMRHRHEDTDYDELLRWGMDKESAREQIGQHV